MAKINTDKKIQKRRTEAEMRIAFGKLLEYSAHNGRVFDIDDPSIVLSDVIEELLELRQEHEDVRGFVQNMHAKMSRR